jgi:hypothetical protein
MSKDLMGVLGAILLRTSAAVPEGADPDEVNNFFNILEEFVSIYNQYLTLDEIMVNQYAKIPLPFLDECMDVVEGTDEE